MENTFFVDATETTYQVFIPGSGLVALVTIREEKDKETKVLKIEWPKEKCSSTSELPKDTYELSKTVIALRGVQDFISTKIKK